MWKQGLKSVFMGAPAAPVRRRFKMHLALVRARQVIGKAVAREAQAHFLAGADFGGVAQAHGLYAVVPHGLLRPARRTASPHSGRC